jgi:ERF superfamily protein
MNAVVERKQPLATVGAASLIQAIAQAAKDPSVDISKMERLMDMHERLTAKEAEMAFNAAMTQCQTEMQQISTDAENTQTRSKYATYAKLDKHMRPIYTRHGFALSFDEGDSPKAEHVRVVCYVSHTAGHSRTYHRDIPADGKGAKGGDVMTKTHAAGAAGSYGARYLLRGIFNVAIGEGDTDGNGAGGMDEGKAADFLAAIDAAADSEELRKTFGAAWTEATKAKDKGAQRLFTEHKDRRKQALGVK